MSQGESSVDGAQRPQVLGYGVVQRLGLTVAAFVLIVGIGLLIPAIAIWVLGQAGEHGLPFKPVVSLVASLGSMPGLLINGVLWALIASAVVRATLRASARIELSANEVRCLLNGENRVLERGAVEAVFPDGKCLVILGQDSTPLFRGPVQASPARLGAAFTALGYPWRERDPFEELFQAWPEGRNGLPDAADALLSARRSALVRKDGAAITDLTRSLQLLGVVAREEGVRQYWRPLVHS